MATEETHALGYRRVDGDPNLAVLVATMDATAEWDATRRLRAWERDQLGLEPVAKTASTQTWDGWDPDESPAPDGCFSMSSLADDLIDAGQLSPRERQGFVSTIHQAARDERLWMALTMFAVIARLPNTTA